MTKEISNSNPKWYDNKWITHLLLIFFFPVGLYALWKSNTLPKWWKIIATIIIVFIVIGSLDSNDSTNQMTQNQSDTKQSTSMESKEYGLKENITVGNFDYYVETPQFRKSIGNQFFNEQTSGYFLIIPVGVTNISKETKTIDSNLFKLYDETDTEYSHSTEGQTALELSGGESFFLKQAQPKIAVNGNLVFEVPEKKAYFLELSGGFWSSKKVRVKIQQY